MTITLNGEPTEVPDGTRVADLLPDATGVAVARNGVVVPRSRLAQEPVRPGDVVEIVTAVQGG